MELRHLRNHGQPNGQTPFFLRLSCFIIEVIAQQYAPPSRPELFVKTDPAPDLRILSNVFRELLIRQRTEPNLKIIHVVFTTAHAPPRMIPIPFGFNYPRGLKLFPYSTILGFQPFLVFILDVLRNRVVPSFRIADLFSQFIQWRLLSIHFFTCEADMCGTQCRDNKSHRDTDSKVIGSAHHSVQIPDQQVLYMVQS